MTPAAWALLNLLFAVAIFAVAVFALRFLPQRMGPGPMVARGWWWWTRTSLAISTGFVCSVVATVLLCTYGPGWLVGLLLYVGLAALVGDIVVIARRRRGIVRADPITMAEAVLGDLDGDGHTGRPGQP